jgi:hypothetical protein
MRPPVATALRRKNMESGNQQLLEKSGVGVVVLAVTVSVIFGLYQLVIGMDGKNLNQGMSLPILAIAGVIGLLITIAVVSISFSVFSLADKTQALALPEGSIRAIIALALVVLFAILSIYLHISMSSPTGQIERIAGLTTDEKNFLERRLTVDQLIAVTPNKATGEAERFTVVYKTVRNPAGDDFAKQVLIMVGTLLTAVSSFYFGAKTAAGKSAAESIAHKSPTSHSLHPGEIARGKDTALDLIGDNLDEIKEVKIRKGASEVAATVIHATANVVNCTINVDQKAPTGAWSVIVTDKAGKSTTLPSTLAVIA